MGQPGVDISTQIKAFLEEAKAAARFFSDRDRLPIECVHVENALVEALDLHTVSDLLDFDWARGRIRSELANYDFRKFFPTLLAEVRFKNSIVPPGVVRRLVEQTVRRNGEIWRIHRNDADPFPSNPHGHNLESGHKLHLGTGELFFGRRLTGKISRKDLMAIREQLVNFNLPALVLNPTDRSGNLLSERR